MRIVFLVPRRAGQPQRDEIWSRLAARLAQLHPAIPVYVGEHNVGPFNRAAALNRASAQADREGRWDFAIILDADVFIRPQQVEEALQRASETGRVTWAFTRWRSIYQEASRRAVADWSEEALLSSDLEGQDMDLIVEKTNPVSWSCCFVVPRAVWDDLGGFDERFQGWGWEDMAFQAAVCGLHGHERLSGDIYHLWHPRSTEREIREGKHSFEYAMNSYLGLRYMTALRVERRMGDQNRDMTPEQVEQDIRNLRADALKLHDRRAGGHGDRLPPAEWWPTLRELIDGWKTSGRTITLCVHTNGRREYLEQTLASAAEKLKGQISKRVLYMDSSDADFWNYCRERWAPEGWRVVGPPAQVGYTRSHALMWEYLTRRCSSEWVFLLEEDFTFDVEIDLDPMIDVLRENPHLRQMALLRHACYPREHAAGGIIQEDPEAYTRAEDGRGNRWLEHRKFWTSNPCLFHRSLCATPWPNAAHSETVYTQVLNRDPASRMAFWGHGEELITHIGENRTGTGY